MEVSLEYRFNCTMLVMHLLIPNTVFKSNDFTYLGIMLLHDQFNAIYIVLSVSECLFNSLPFHEVKNIRVMDVWSDV